MSYASSRQGASLPLVNLDAAKILRWSKVLEVEAKKHGELFLCSDTETTGTRLVDPKTKLFCRVLEWSMCFCYKDERGVFHQILDEKGCEIIIDEPINPFIEKSHSKKQQKSINYIPPDSVEVHGITEEYLFGENVEGIRPTLPRPAATFVFVFEALMELLNFPYFRTGDLKVHLVFHNANFDVGFINQEMSMNGLPPIETYFLVICSFVDMAKKILNTNQVDNMSLNTLSEWVSSRYPEHTKQVDRPLHTALIDSLILVNVMTGLTLRANEIKSESC